jgi:hypothetical protein
MLEHVREIKINVRSLMDMYIIGFFVAVSLSSVVLVIWFRSNQNRISRNYVKRALEMGFEPLEDEDWALLHRLATLHRRIRIQKLEVRNIYTKQGPDYELYLFDLFVMDLDAPSRISQGNIAVLSRSLRMPRVSIMPTLRTGSYLDNIGDMIRKIFPALAPYKLSTISFEEYPEFEHQYTVYGQDEKAVRSFLSDQVLQRLKREQNWQIEAERDLLAFNKVETDYLKTLKSDIQIKQLVDDALTVFDLFKDR